MHMRKRRLFCTSSHQNVPYEKQQGIWALKWVSLQERVRNCFIHSTWGHTWAYYMDKISRRLFYIYIEIGTIYESSWVMKGVCHLWSRGRPFSPSCDVRYLRLSPQKRPTGRNLGGNRLVRRSGTTSRGTVFLVFCLRMRRFLLTLVLIISLGMKWTA